MRSSLASLLISVDIPALRRPTTASFITGAGTGRSSKAVPGRSSMIFSYSSVNPSPFCALIAKDSSPTPSTRNSSTPQRSCSPSTLFTTRRTGRPIPRNRRATSSSSGVTPSRTSTTNRISSATSSAPRICSSTCGPRSSRSTMPMPPVSITSTQCSGTPPKRRAGTAMRSRVTPAVGSTIETRLPTMRLSSVDLPTFGRPTMATRRREVSWVTDMARGRGAKGTLDPGSIASERPAAGGAGEPRGGAGLAPRRRRATAGFPCTSGLRSRRSGAPAAGRGGSRE